MVGLWRLFKGGTREAGSYMKALFAIVVIALSMWKLLDMVYDLYYWVTRPNLKRKDTCKGPVLTPVQQEAARRTKEFRDIQTRERKRQEADPEYWVREWLSPEEWLAYSSSAQLERYLNNYRPAPKQ